MLHNFTSKRAIVEGNHVAPRVTVIVTIFLYIWMHAGLFFAQICKIRAKKKTENFRVHFMFFAQDSEQSEKSTTMSEKIRECNKQHKKYMWPLQAIMARPKFHGVMMPTTLTDWGSMTARWPSALVGRIPLPGGIPLPALPPLCRTACSRRSRPPLLAPPPGLALLQVHQCGPPCGRA